MTRIVLILTLALVLAAGCGSGAGDGGGRPDRTDVVAAFYPLAYAAERIGGSRVEITNLTPTGAEPHDVELSARDVERVRSADVVLYLGGGFQPAVEKAVEGAEGRTLDLLRRLRLLRGGDGVDPHAWLDPLRYEHMVERVGAALGRRHAARELARELRLLHAEYRGGLRSCERSEIVVGHGSFGYLADRYRLRQVAISGLSPEAEPTPRDLERVVETVRELQATTVFAETLVSPRLAKTVARETGAEIRVLNPLEGLTDDERAAGETYFTVMRDNLDALRRALACR